MTKQTTVSTSIKNDQEVNKKACIKHEVQAYLIYTNINENLSPLEWWRVIGGKYRNVARFVRKWLAVPSTPTPSERLLSIWGLVDTAERSNFLGVSTEKQVFRYNNINKIH